jgi:hypothetical protein
MFAVVVWFGLVWLVTGKGVREQMMFYSEADMKTT